MNTDAGTPLKPEQSRTLQLIGAMIERGEPLTTVERDWRTFIEKSAGELTQSLPVEAGVDVHALIALVLREAWTEMNRDLQFLADKVKFLSALKRQIREELDRTRKVKDDYIASLEQQLSSVGDDAQLASIHLQNMLQKQQQTLQMLSNVSKVLPDTAMAVIRNIA